MPHTKTPGTGNKTKFVLLWIVSYTGVSLCSLMPSAAMSLVAFFGDFGEYLVTLLHTYIRTYTHTYITICRARCVDSTEYTCRIRGANSRQRRWWLRWIRWIPCHTLTIIHGTYLFRLDKIHFNSRRTLGMLIKWIILHLFFFIFNNNYL